MKGEHGTLKQSVIIAETPGGTERTTLHLKPNY